MRLKDLCKLTYFIGDPHGGNEKAVGISWEHSPGDLGSLQAYLRLYTACILLIVYNNPAKARKERERVQVAWATRRKKMGFPPK